MGVLIGAALGLKWDGTFDIILINWKNDLYFWKLKRKHVGNRLDFGLELISFGTLLDRSNQHPASLCLGDPAGLTQLCAADGGVLVRPY